MRVLVADDMALVRKRIAEYLGEAGCHVVAQHTNGLEAIEWMRANPGAVDAMFLDVEMPPMSGMEVAAEFPEIPAVIATGHKEYAVAAFEQEAVDYILKPISPERIRRAVEKLEKRVRVASGSQNVRINIGDRIRLVPVSIIEGWEVNEREVRAHVNGRSYPTDYRTLVEVESAFPEKFFRSRRNRLDRVDTASFMERKSANGTV